MKKIAFAVGLALSSAAYGGTDLNFVRSARDCDANGCGLQNGSSFANAWRTFAGPVYGATDGTANVVDPEDVLILCSEDFGPEDVDTATVMIAPNNNISGTAVAHTRWSGDCSAYGGPKRARIDGKNVIARGFDVGSTNRTYIKLDNIEVTGFTDACVLNQGVSTDVDNWVLDYMWIHDCRGETAQGYWGRGGYVTITNSVIERTGEDNVWNEGDYFTFRYNEAHEPGLDASGLQGDNVQIGGVAQAVGFDISYNKFSTEVDVKQCVLAGTAGLPVSGYLVGNECDGPGKDAVSHSSYFVRGTGTVHARQNFAKESRYLIYASDGVTLKASGNWGERLSSYGIQCGTGAVACELEHNTVIDAPVCYSTESATGTSIIRANIGAACSTVGVRKNAGDTEAYNILHNTGDPVQNETTSTSLAGTSTTADPMLNSEGRPRAGSPACNAVVTTVPGMYYDGQRFGTQRTIGAMDCETYAEDDGR